MSLRPEVVTSLYEEIQAVGHITLSNDDWRQAHNEVEKARRLYEEARKRLLRHNLARYYRVVIFGSARLDDNSEEFKFISQLSKALVEEVRIGRVGVDIVTGGGPGIMKAAHFGVQLARDEAAAKGRRLATRSHGITIALPTQEPANGLINIQTSHPEFSTRLQEFLDKTRAAYNASGGIGTLLEMAMVLQLRQVGHLESDYPILAHPHWQPVVDTWNDELYHKRFASGRVPLINQTDLELIQFSADIPDIVGIIGKSHAFWHENVRSRVRISR